MKETSTRIASVKVIEPKVFADDRGLFFESFNQRTLAEFGIRESFVQDNQSVSRRGVLRGLHYQVQQPQGKLIRCLYGEIFDVAVDLRRSSATFGQWVGETLTGENRRMLWIPAGFAHGFLVLSETAEVLYKTTDFYAPRCERTILWNDPTLHIDWPLSGAPVLSGKDLAGQTFEQAEVYE
ncbi:MAG TPA: dTDP-4-dehydrorhamnose 3,5-epimerase [Acidobacteriaceae bacterium]|nr:dTDP-4-dehydrorhamnose 3,5-epimerase [Acidobacteriaceae bacterium]